jgi:DNA-binding MarR family transcriptional regulator
MSYRVATIIALDALVKVVSSRYRSAMADASIYQRISRLSRLLQADDRGRTDLLPVQLQALQYLARCNRFSDSPASVADYLGITKGTASQTLKVIENAGLVSKQVDPTDRRVVHVRLTEEGRAVAEAANSGSLVQAATAALDERERDALDASLSALLKALNESTGGRTFGACRSCRHFQEAAGTGFRCGLLHESLSNADVELICREHDAGGTT